MFTFSTRFAPILAGALLAVPMAQAEDYITIDHYLTGYDRFTDATPVNARLHVNPKAVLAPISCFANSISLPIEGESKSAPQAADEGDAQEDAAAGGQPSDAPCPKVWRNYVRRCQDAIGYLALIRSAANREIYKAPEYYPQVFISKMTPDGKLALVVRHYEGGSGGMRHDWSISMLSRDANGQYACPAAPFLSGIDVLPNVDKEPACRKGEAWQACEQRLYFPPRLGQRMVFGSKGMRVQAHPMPYRKASYSAPR